MHVGCSLGGKAAIHGRALEALLFAWRPAGRRWSRRSSRLLARLLRSGARHGKASLPPEKLTCRPGEGSWLAEAAPLLVALPLLATPAQLLAGRGAHLLGEGSSSVRKLTV
ncbi:hypothetical protein Dimus_037219, partial [Dionaea muscipula]